jgi:hypothetical protein
MLPEPAPHGLPEAYEVFRASMDVLINVAAPEDELAIFFDCPWSHSVRFYPPDEIWVDVGGETGYAEQIGTFQEGVPLHLDVVLNTHLQTWGIVIDGQPVFTGDYPSEELWTVRISMASNEDDDPVAIDNIYIEGLGVSDCPADLDGNGTVDVSDLLALLANWGGSGDGDLNDDGIVDVEDLLALLGAWGPCS